MKERHRLSWSKLLIYPQVAFMTNFYRRFQVFRLLRNHSPRMCIEDTRSTHQGNLKRRLAQQLGMSVVL